MNKTRARKAQTTFIILFGLAAFVAFAIFFTAQREAITQPQIPPAVAELKKLLRNDIEQIIKAKSLSTLETLGLQGGYVDVPFGPTVNFGGYEMPYWQVCQNDRAPTVEELENRTERGVARELNRLNITEFQGKEVRISRVDRISAEISRDEVLIKVWMPVKLDIYNMEQPFEVKLTTRLGYIHEFASNFVKDNSQKRYFERFMISLVYHTGSRTLPTIGLLTSCGDSIHKSWGEVAASIKRIIDYALSHLVFWKPGSSDYLDMSIPDVGGKTYPDLDINFYPVGELTRSRMGMSQDPIHITNSKRLYFLLPFCVEEFDISYSFHMPIVATVKDESNYTMNFAILPVVSNNKIGLCSDVQYFENVTTDVCAEAKCSAKIRVVDTQGEPIPNAKVIAGQCMYGFTDPAGEVEGKIPCGVFELTVAHPDYITYYDTASHADADRVVTLKKPQLIRVHFSKVTISTLEPTPLYLCFNYTGACNYKLSTSPVSSEELAVEMGMKNPSSPWEQADYLVSNTNEAGETVQFRTVSHIPPGNYSANISLFGIPPGSGSKKEMGWINTTHLIPALPEQDMYVKVPTFGYETRVHHYGTFYTLMQMCGIEPLSRELGLSGCYVYGQSYSTLDKVSLLNSVLNECGISRISTTGCDNACLESRMDDKIQEAELSCKTRVIF